MSDLREMSLGSLLVYSRVHQVGNVYQEQKIEEKRLSSTDYERRRQEGKINWACLCGSYICRWRPMWVWATVPRLLSPWVRTEYCTWNRY